MTCFDCPHRKEDEEGNGYCDKTSFWLPLHDKSYCCVWYPENVKKSRRKDSNL